jgi:hypothetical protein
LKIESAHLVHPLKEVGLNGLYAFFIIWKKWKIDKATAKWWLLFFPRLTDTGRQLKEPRPISQWTLWVDSDRWRLIVMKYIVENRQVQCFVWKGLFNFHHLEYSLITFHTSTFSLL